HLLKKKTSNAERLIFWTGDNRDETEELIRIFFFQHSNRREERKMKSRALPLDVGRWALSVGRFLFLLLLISRSLHAQESSGYGPPTLIPLIRSTVSRAALPSRNSIYQTHEDTDTK